MNDNTFYFLLGLVTGLLIWLFFNDIRSNYKNKGISKWRNPPSVPPKTTSTYSDLSISAMEVPFGDQWKNNKNGKIYTVMNWNCKDANNHGTHRYDQVHYIDSEGNSYFRDSLEFKQKFTKI